MAARVKGLTISKRRLLSATAITRRLPPQSILSPQNNSGYGKISFFGSHAALPSWLVSKKRSGATKEEDIDCYFKTSDYVKKLAEEENIADMLHKCKTIKQLKEVHLQMLTNCMRSDDDSNYLADKLMLLSPDLISFDYAYKVFTGLPSSPSLPSYNTLIRCSIGKSDKIAVSAYNRLRSNDDNNLFPDRFTLAFLLKCFTSFGKMKSGRTMHGHVIKLGFVSDTFVMNSLLEFYFEFVRGRKLRAVRKVFDEISKRDVASWNTMLSGLVKRVLCREALLVFNNMLLAGCGCKPDETTLINVLFACSLDNLMEQGKWLDSYIKENKFVLSLPLGNALIKMFVCFEDLGNAKMVFKSMSKRCTTTWKRMLLGLVGEGFCNEAVVLFDTMCCCSEEVEGGLQLNNDFFWLVLLAFEKDERLVGDGKQLFRVIHQFVHGFGVKPNKKHYQLMITLLSRAGWVEAAMMLVECLPGRASDYDSLWGCVLFNCQVSGNDLLLDSLIRKMYDIHSSDHDHRPPSQFLRLTLEKYIRKTMDQGRHNDDDNVSFAKSMVETLVRKLPDQKHVDKFSNFLENRVKENALREASRQRKQDLSIVQHTFTPRPHHHHDDVCKALQSLDRQFSDYLHDQTINIIDDPNRLLACF